MGSRANTIYGDNAAHDPSNAYDGDYDTIYAPKDGDTDNWIEFDLERESRVGRVTVTNRQDCCQHIIDNTSIYVKRKDGKDSATH